MPTYSVKCPNCGSRSSFVSKIENRDLTPVCPMCGTITERSLDTPMIQAQTISGLIQDGNGNLFEGKNQFEKHMKDNDLISASESFAESKIQKENRIAEKKKEIRNSVEKIVNDTGV